MNADRNNHVSLRNVVEADLPFLYEMQLDPEANAMAAVIPRDEDAFFPRWKDILKDARIAPKAILLNGELVGQISMFYADELPSIGYWLAREWWGKGVASRALPLLLEEVKLRPLHACVAAHNVASLRILEKSGFKIVGREHRPGDDRYLPCEEVMFTLE